MEDVIVGLLFVYFFVIRPVLKQVKRARGGGEGQEPAKAPARRVTLSQLLAKARKKLREAAEQAEAAKRKQAAAPAASAWDALFAGPAAEPAAEPWAGGPDAEERVAWGDAAAARERTPTEPEPAAPLDAAQTVSAPERPGWRGVPVAELRRAVIWSEILAPPVSLREG